MSSVRASDLVVRSPDGGVLLDGASLTVTSAELCLLAGRNGAGKTLLARALAGLIRPDGGRVSTDGSPPALVFQHTASQVLGQTVAEDVALGPRSAGLPRVEVDRRVEAALGRTGLRELGNRDPLTLSGGEQRRLSIASLIALEPEILILDEPFSSLDYEGVHGVLSLLLEIHAAGCGLLIITHDLEKVAAHADRLILIDGGRIVADGAPAATLPHAERCGLRVPRGTVEEMSWLR